MIRGRSIVVLHGVLLIGGRIFLGVPGPGQLVESKDALPVVLLASTTVHLFTAAASVATSSFFRVAIMGRRHTRGPHRYDVDDQAGTGRHRC
jgi:hypothetical protein